MPPMPMLWETTNVPMTTQNAPSGRCTRRSDDESPPSLNATINALFGTLTALPHAIFDQGAEHGREIRQRMYTPGNGAAARDADGSGRTSTSRGGGGASAPGGTPGAGDDDGDDGRGDSWMDLVVRQVERSLQQMQRNEQRANEFYDKWKKEVDGSLTRVSAEDRATAGDGLLWWLKTASAASESWHMQDECRSRSLEDDICDMVRHDRALSPRWLETRPGFDNSWRVRFEDLLRVQSGLELMTKEEAEMLQRMTREDWMDGYVQRKDGFETLAHSRPPWIRTHSIPSSDMNDGHAETTLGKLDKPKSGSTRNDESSESMDKAYSQLLIPPGEGKTTAAVRQLHSEKPDSSTADSPKAFMTIRSVNTTTNQDGSVTTKTVVKQRYADGRKTVSETLKTTPPPPRSARQGVPKSGEQGGRRGKNPKPPNPKVSQDETDIPTQQVQGWRRWIWSS